MTEVITQTAAHAFGMSSSQRTTRRRSARLAFDEEEDTRPAKKAKTSETTTTVPTKQPSTKKTTGASKKAKTSKTIVQNAYQICAREETRAVGSESCANQVTAYEEEADGFQFSRAKAKKPAAGAATKAGSAHPATEPAKPAEKPARSTSTRGKRPLPEAPPEDKDEPRRRRSARLSGDDLEKQPSVTVKPKASSKTKAKEPIQTKQVFNEARKEIPQDAPSLLKTPRVEALRAEGRMEEQAEEQKGPTKIALPFADTPVIQRNKEMRKNSAQGHRRSSAGMRGRRASSLMDTGMSNGTDVLAALSEWIG